MEKANFIYPKADIGDRIVAHLLDSVICFIGCLFLVIPGLAYSFIMDGLGKGQSIGKKNRELMLINTTTNEPCTIGGSVIRALIMIGFAAIPFIGIAFAVYTITSTLLLLIHMELVFTINYSTFKLSERKITRIKIL